MLNFKFKKPPLHTSLRYILALVVFVMLWIGIEQRRLFRSPSSKSNRGKDTSEPLLKVPPAAPLTDAKPATETPPITHIQPDHGATIADTAKRRLQMKEPLYANRSDTLLVYCILLQKHNCSEAVYDTSLKNLHFFLDHGVFRNNSVDYYFLIVEGTNMSMPVFPDYENVHVKHIRNAGSDLGNFHILLETEFVNLGDYQYYGFTNIGVRGPFVNPPNPNWIGYFRDRLSGPEEMKVCVGSDCILAVGSTFNCEIQPHLQTHFIAFSRMGMEIAFENWGKCATEVDHWTVIHVCELGLTTEIIAKGYGMAAMYPSMWSVKVPELRYCGTPYMPARNPISELVQNPYDVIFVKFGGNVMKGTENNVNPRTLAMVKEETAYLNFNHRPKRKLNEKRITNSGNLKMVKKRKMRKPTMAKPDLFKIGKAGNLDMSHIFAETRKTQSRFFRKWPKK